MQDVTKDRHLYIGGSDIPMIMRLSSFKTRYDLLLEKAQLKESDFQGNKYTEYGNVMEPKIRDYINEIGETKFIETKKIVDNKRYHSDGFNCTTILEIKTTSNIKNSLLEYKTYLVQCLYGMMVNDSLGGILAIYERPSDFDEEFNSKNLTSYGFALEDHLELCNEINLAVDNFWSDLDKIKTAYILEGVILTEEDLMNNDVVTISNKVLDLEKQLLDFKTIENEYKDQKAKLKLAMETENIKMWTTPNGTKITLVADIIDKEVLAETLNEELFKEEEPVMIKRYDKIKKEYDLKKEKYIFSTTKIKKGRSGYVKITLKKEV